MEKNLEAIKMLIRFYNMQAGCSLSVKSTRNKDAVELCMDRLGTDDIVPIKNHIREWVKWAKETAGEDADLSGRFEECLEAIEIPNNNGGDSAEPTGNKVSESIGLLERVVAQMVTETQSEKNNFRYHGIC